ncbi:uncharacterized protein PV09_06428 [Verruconis gallopava]|uniref:Aminoglycoside phosphotransferase domain-containing protein n=1 Tax=Verruconis gallopava TaxID=253628 RepID=A0A0D2A6A4_9PEZI|nr:uncharacterized protein PV09_06428 [Verruconis gallopava]KIW02278.1 hypothetical protein PV09_06428 [Verruconis gallopava]
MDHVPAEHLLRSISRLCDTLIQSLGIIEDFIDDDVYHNNVNSTRPTAIVLPDDESHDLNMRTSEGVEARRLGERLQIPHDKLKELAISHLGNQHGNMCEIVNIHEGSHNQVHVVQFVDGAKYIVRVPARGIKGHWLDVDATALRSQACTMNYVRRKTGLPIPEVLLYSGTCDNMLGHPYMLTTFLEGRPVCRVWHEISESPDREAQRMAILKSIAYAMTKLSALSFDAGGCLYFEESDDCEPKIGPLYVAHECTGSFQHRVELLPPYRDSYSHYQECLSRWWKEHPCRKYGQQVSPIVQGQHEVLQVLLDCLPFHKSTILFGSEEVEADEYLQQNEGPQFLHDDYEYLQSMYEESAESLVEASVTADEDDKDEKYSNTSGEKNEEFEHETFVLAPPVFDWQNILIDDENNVTGFLDWDKACTVPRYLGWAATPLWLSREYNSHDSTWNGDIKETIEDFQRYRRAYATFMTEALDGQGDCKFTDKSRLFAAMVSAISEPGYTMFKLCQILSTVLPRTSMVTYFERIGNDGWCRGERCWLRNKLGQLFDCRPGVDPTFSF